MAWFQIILWLAAICLGIAVMQWGSQRVCSLAGALRGRLGLPATAAGALIGLATASPEISINVAAVLFGWPDLGLGSALGSNVPAIPFVFAIAYASTRLHRAKAKAENRPQDAPRSVPHVEAGASWLQGMPYLLVVALLALLTLPPPWAGLQPVDGAILLAAFLLYFARATVGQARNANGVELCRTDLWHATVGLGAIAAGAVLAVVASRKVNQAFGISDLIGGLFITGLLCALPECFAAWKLARKGEATSAISGTLGDGIASLTVALIPVSLVGLALSDTPLYVANLGFVAACLVFYMAANHPRWGERLTFLRIVAYGGGYAAYLAVVFLVTRP